MAEIDKRDHRIVVRFTENMHARINELAELYQQPASVLCANWIAEKVVSLENQKNNQTLMSQAIVESIVPLFEQMAEEAEPMIEQANPVLVNGLEKS